MDKNPLYNPYTYSGDSSLNFEFLQISKKKKREALILFSLVIFGVLGFLYVFDCVQIRPMVPMQIKASSFLQNTSQNNFQNLKMDHFVSLSGSMSVTEPVHLKLLPSVSANQYIIHFGDGSEPQQLSTEIEHTYNTLGNYTMTLEAVSPEDKRIWLTKKIQIQ